MSNNAISIGDALNGRFGLRPEELADATGISLPTIRRRIQSKDIRVTQIGRLQIITKAELVRLGLIQTA